MRRILVAITFNAPDDDPEQATGLDINRVWNAMQREFPYSHGSDWTVQEYQHEVPGLSAVPGEKVGGR